MTRRVGPARLIFLTALFGLLLAATSGTSAATAFTVNSTRDAVDATIGDGVCADATGACTLRAAIQESNAPPVDKDSIAFAIPTGPLSIAPTTLLPTLTDPVVIDGTTQPGFAGTPIVEVRGPGNWGFRVSGGDSTIRGLVINRFNVEIELATNGGNIISGNFIGTDVTGMLDGGGSTSSPQVVVLSGGGNRIGGATPADRNVIARRAPQQVYVNSSDNVIEGNFIGTDVTGNAAIPGSSMGVLINVAGAMRNVVGGTVEGAGNLISGHVNGVIVRGRETVIQGNLVGTNASGTERVPNSNGITIQADAAQIGGLDPQARNVISGNGNNGISLQSIDAVVQGNLIGPDITGTKTPGSANAPGNGGHGLHICGGGRHLIGAADSRARNIISGNGAAGINLCNGTSHNRIKGNFIGTKINGTEALGNRLGGIICCILGSVDNAIGGAEVGAGNVIAYNGINHGVSIGGTPAAPGHHPVLGNSIHSNGRLGIDLFALGGGGGPNRPTLNDPGDADEGGNDLQNFPVLDWTSTGNQTTVTGTLNSKPNETYRLEFFHNRACDTFDDPSPFTFGRFGEGETFLGAIDVTTDAGGDVSFAATYPVPTGVTEVITATATNSRGSTSEFSECRADLEITKADQPDPVLKGQTLTYTIEVVNQGPAPVLEVVVNDQLPSTSSFALTSITPSQGSCSGTGGSRTCALGMIPRDATATITITGTVTANPPQTITNTARVSSELTDPDLNDNAATAQTQVVQQLPTGTIVVTKETLPAGSPQSFAFTASYDSDGFSLTDGQSNTSGPLTPGSYSVSETPVQGWDVSASCSDGSPPTNIGLSAGETVTCTFTNTQRGTIVVEKQTSPDGASGSFTFTGDAAGTLSDNGRITVPNLPPGTYRSTEAVVNGWTLTAIACNDANSSGDLATRTATFRLDAGETVTCSFTNTQQQQRGTIVVEKQTSPDGASGSFAFTGDAAGTLSDNGRITRPNLPPGTYRSTEAVASGWTLTEITCNDANSSGDLTTRTATFRLDPGETVTCTFTNAVVFAPGGGAFVIGDKNAAIGNGVTFWGAQWWKLNSLSGGTAPAAFKGFAKNPSRPSCGTGWSTDPGNSAPPPPGPLPSYIGVIVASSITKSGSRISGNTIHIVIVKTNAGYAPNPGHAGTGTVVATVC